ncbi:MAG: hypothetical protein GX786_06075 [Clostridiales bacterium]|nr:hypothetical protein [Clostridiales bacterium]
MKLVGKRYTDRDEEGWIIQEKGWFLERYHDPRFTVSDQEGKVRLDICAYLK